MDRNAEIIRTEIIRILNENGRTRGTDLARRVIDRMGNEKTVYREISGLVESGEVEKRVHNRSHIEYELVDLHASVNDQLRDLHGDTKDVLDEIRNFNWQGLPFHERVWTVIHLIHTVQSAGGVTKLLSSYPTFKKDRMFPQVGRSIDDCWQAIMGIIARQEEAFMGEVIAGLRVDRFDTDNVN